MEPKLNVALVGAWADGSSWDAISRQRNRVVLLRERAGTGQRTP